METIKNAIVCLGKSFESEDERREYFKEELRKRLPELKRMEGFPIGEDEDIINLSDPPYYTACPNPWLNDFINEWENAKEENLERKKEFHVTNPYASDISEGKNNPIYNAHGYHTKVPHPAIMQYILHYTQPGDIILDGFSGTGMTGVAAQLCENPDMETKIKIETAWRTLFNTTPRWGIRHAILEDLSPMASFISYNYNTPVDLIAFEIEAKRILHEVERDYGKMYETIHSNGIKGKINYTIWSEIFSCPECGGDIEFWKIMVDQENGKVREIFNCPFCDKELERSLIEKKWTTQFDTSLNQSVKQIKTVPVLVNYVVGNKRYDKQPDENDINLATNLDWSIIKDWYPTNELPPGDKMGDPFSKNIRHIHQFWTIRNLRIIAAFWERSTNEPKIRWMVSSILQRATKQHQIAISRVGGEKSGDGGKTAGHRRGTLYIPSLQAEFSVIELIKERLKVLLKALAFIKEQTNVISTNSATKSTLKDNSIDYIFIDPPFGANIMYSELNYIWEAWLKVRTNNKNEAIENKTQKKKSLDYQVLITRCFEEYFRILKPGKWMTIVFSNTSAAVWNGVQTAIQRAGFVVANVTALHKKQETHSARTTATAVKQDLVISCYKPSSLFEENFQIESAEVNVWNFVNEYLQHLPIHIKKNSSTNAIVERSPKILYDRLIRFYFMRNLPTPIDAKDFQLGLRHRFAERDGMFFTIDQVAEYEFKKAQAPDFVQMSILVTTESEAIEWLRAKLVKPQTYQELHPVWLQSITAIRKGDILPELKDLLSENFIQQEDGTWRLPNLNEARDRDILRLKSLQREFGKYVADLTNQKLKKLKEVRVEALRVGFKDCWERKNFTTIVKIGDLIPQNILLEDEQLLMYYDIAKDRV